MKAVRFHTNGGPEVLKYEDVDTPKPNHDEALIKLEAIGVNYIDIYQRSGQYATPLPTTAGGEGSGTVVEVGSEVSEVAVGELVAYTGPLGAYAEYAVVPAWRLVKLPTSINPSTAAALMLQGMTAHYLTHTTYPLKKGDTCLIHAAAGGVGLLLIQMAKKLGAQVIGTVSTKEKAQLAHSVGADETIIYTQNDFEKEVLRITDGQRIEVVYDSVGKSTFDQSINCLAPRGCLVLYGQASGPVPNIDPQILNSKGSLFLTRPSLGHHTLNRSEILGRANTIFEWVSKGDLSVRVHASLPLNEAAEAHRLLASRTTTGKIVLVP